MVLLGMWQGFLQGFMSLLFNLGSLVLATLVTLWSLPRVGDWMEGQLRIPLNYARPIALGVIFLITSTFFSIVGNILHKLFAPILHASIVNRVVGTALGGLRSALISGIVLTLLLALPVPKEVKAAVNKSWVAKPLIQGTLKLEQWFEKRVDPKAIESVVYQTVGQDQSTTTALNYTVDNPQLDLVGEEAMLRLTNEIRQKQGVPALKMHASLRDVARGHAKDMLARGYFSHLSPQGEDAAGRVKREGIAVISLGENLASAPTVVMAQGGLLASEGHRKNILNPDFNQVGIGVFDAGVHGKMVVELFAQIP